MGIEAQIPKIAVRNFPGEGKPFLSQVCPMKPGGKASRESHRFLDPREGKHDTAATFPVYCDPHSQSFGIVNKEEIDVSSGTFLLFQ